MIPNGKMKALAYDDYGTPDVLHFCDIDIPTPKNNQVLVKVHAVSINAGDIHLMEGTPFPLRLVTGIFRPRNKILGLDISGHIVNAGKDVLGFKVGDEVYGSTSIFEDGCFAEYVCLQENKFAFKPKSISFEEAAALPTAGATALQSIKKFMPSEPYKKVLINGASGGVGTFAIQIAKSLGCEVTAVCSTRHIEIVRSLGADRIIDYKTSLIFDTDEKYDLVYAVNGNNSIFDYQKLLKKDGAYVTSGGTTQQMFQAMMIGPFMRSSKISSLTVVPTIEDLTELSRLTSEKKIRPVIDKVYQKEQIIDAIKYFYSGCATGKVVVVMCKE
ncbi:Quinone-oxidoreductase-like protein, chloroplastic [Smittium culicis]|uniref:Quinone-oxidoreductase-like protein, chloroplastic n=1 Tax=Smittium culicis TaxID=133412 RepID=A0A1R1XWN8_9FUNG|nr:Quinone-oxidoreductase-like protein, chloroplastic [Smittium culicis]